MKLTRSRWGRRALFSALYFSEGAPIGYIWWAMPTRLSDAGMPVDRVTAVVSLLVLPWVLKFLWAPVIDASAGTRFGLRGWILCAQALMGLTLLGLLPLDLGADITLVSVLLVGHAFFAATQDVAIDSLAVRTIAEDERGTLNAWMQGGMLLSRGVFGGLALWAEHYVGGAVVIAVLIGCIWFSGVMVLFAEEPPLEEGRAGKQLGPVARVREIGSHLVRALASVRTWIGLGVALTAGAGFEAAGALLGPMLLERGMPSEEIGLFRAVPVIVCMVLGSFLGGYLADKLGRLRVLGGCIVATAVAVAVTGLLFANQIGTGAPAPGLLSLETVSFGAVYLTLGALTSVSYAVFMDLTDPALGGTQFSAYMSATNLCESWSARTVGVLAKSGGYGLALPVLAGLSLVSLPLVWALSRFRGRARA